MRRIYMDANATTPLLPEVLEAMRPYFLEQFGNASSIHQHGQQARAAVEYAREQVASLLNCRESEIVFTSGGTESDNMALFGLLKPGDHLITTRIEHHAVLHAAEQLEKRGVEVTWLGCDSRGVVSVEALREALQREPVPGAAPHTTLVSIMMANNETGVIQPLAALAIVAHQAGAIFHTDAVQAAGKIPIDVRALGCDLLSISGHKMHAPQGTGILYVRRGIKLQPLFFGGSHERQRRPGTENVAGIVGLGKAAEIAKNWLAGDGPKQLATLRDKLEQGILAQVDEAGINGANEDGVLAPRVPNTTNVWFDHIEGEALVIALDLKGIAVSGGSACASGATEPSHVLTAMGLSAHRARASVRFSMTKLITEEEIDAALQIIPAAAARLRELSPTYKPAEAAAAAQ
ncbi:MAG: cysteine desulfurase family protein [Acidobacteriaceae bacterium]